MDKVSDERPSTIAITYRILDQLHHHGDEMDNLLRIVMRELRDYEALRVRHKETASLLTASSLMLRYQGFVKTAGVVDAFLAKEQSDE